MGAFPPGLLAAFEVFAEVVVLTKVMFASRLLLAIVRWTEEKGLLLMGTDPWVVLSVVEGWEGVAFLLVAMWVWLEAEAESPAGEATLPTVDPVSVEIVTAPKTSVWLVVSTERTEVSSMGLMLTVTKVVLGVVGSATIVSPSMLLLAVSRVSTVVSGVAGSVALAAAEVSAEVMVSVKCDSASVESNTFDTSEGDKAFLPVGSRSTSEVLRVVAVIIILIMLQLVISMSVML